MQADCVLPDAVKREGSRDAGNAMSYNLPHFTAAFDHLPHQASGWSTAPEVFQPAFHTASSRHSRLQLAASAYGQKPPIRHINKRAWNDSTTQNSTCKQSRVAQMKCTCPVRRCLAASHTSTKQRRPHILDTEALAEQVEVLSLLQASTDCWSPAGWLKPDPHMKFQTAHTQRQICAQKRAECAAVATQPCPSLSISNESNRAHNDVPDMTQQAVTSIHSNAYQSDSALDALLEPNRQALQQCEGSTPQLAQGGALQAGVHEQPQEGGHRLAYAVSQEQADASGKQQGSVQGTTEGDGGQKGLVPEQGAAAMAAWLLQQPKLLQGLLDQLENIAAPDLPAAAVAPSDAGYKQPHGDVAAVQRAQHEDDNSNGVGQADNTLSTENRQCSSVDTAAVLMKNCAPYDSSEHSAHGVVEQQASSRNGICMLLCAGDRSEGADGASGANRGNAGLVSSHDTASDNIGRQLLEHSRAGRYDDARQLLKQGAALSSLDGAGNTPLMLACQHGHGRLVKLLVRKGADMQMCNLEGLTAEQLAHGNMHSSIVKFLRASQSSQIEC